MDKYQKPVVQMTEGLAEGVFAASGTAVNSSGCEVKSWVNGSMGAWGGHHKQQVGWAHGDSSHNCKGDILIIELSAPCTFYDVWGRHEVLEDGGTTIRLRYTDSYAIGNVVEDLHFDGSVKPAIVSFTVECHN